MTLERSNRPATDAAPEAGDPALQRRSVSPLRLVRLGPSAPRTSYEQALAIELAEHARLRVRREWSEADMAELYERLEGFLRDPAPSYQETAALIGESEKHLSERVHCLRVDWLEALAEELEELLGRPKRLIDDFDVAPAHDAKQSGSEPLPLEAAFGEDAYQLIGKLGSGLHGSVYRARPCDSNAVVALKMFDGKEADLQRFYREFELARQLQHPNIVNVYASGVFGGRPCFSMEFVTGGGLDAPAQLARFRNPAQAASLLIRVARAVQFAHERGVLHLDLKPSNILIADDAEPKLGDFSLGRALSSEAVSNSSTISGSFAYMAPEQAGAREEPVSAATDVYGLGAILYKLLTGNAPNPDSLPDLLRHFDDAKAPAPLSEKPASGISKDLETVCLTALEHAPLQRYQTAAAFADDLERALQGRPTRVRPRGALGRLALWRRRHPLLASLVAIASVAMLVINGSMLVALRAQRQELLEATLTDNATMAALQAQHVASVLEGYARRVEEIARDPAVSSLAQGPVVKDVPAPALALHAKASAATTVWDFDSLFVISLDGYQRARWPEKPLEKWLGSRDYFRRGLLIAQSTAGSKPFASHVYLSAVFLAGSKDNSLKFALSTPLYGSDGQTIGLLVATKNASSTLDDVPIKLFGGQQTALLAPREQLSMDPASRRFEVIVHDGLRGKDEYLVPDEFGARAQRTFGAAAPPGEQFAPRLEQRPMMTDNYLDPVPGFDGRWLAGLSPVAGTGYVVAVVTRYRGVSTLQYALFMTINLAFVLLSVAMAFRTLRRQRSSRR